MLTPATTASSVSPPAFRTSMARAQARSPLALEMTMVLEVWAEAMPSAGSKAEPSMTALRLIPLSLFIFRSTCTRLNEPLWHSFSEMMYSFFSGGI